MRLCGRCPSGSMDDDVAPSHERVADLAAADVSRHPQWSFGKKRYRLCQTSPAPKTATAEISSRGPWTDKMRRSAAMVLGRFGAKDEHGCQCCCISSGWENYCVGSLADRQVRDVGIPALFVAMILFNLMPLCHPCKASLRGQFRAFPLQLPFGCKPHPVLLLWRDCLLSFCTWCLLLV